MPFPNFLPTIHSLLKYVASSKIQTKWSFLVFSFHHHQLLCSLLLPLVCDFFLARCIRDGDDDEGNLNSKMFLFVDHSPMCVCVCWVAFYAVVEIGSGFCSICGWFILCRWFSDLLFDDDGQTAGCFLSFFDFVKSFLSLFCTKWKDTNGDAREYTRPLPFLFPLWSFTPNLSNQLC